MAELRAVEYLLDAADEYIQQDYMRYFHGEASNRHNSAIAEHMTIVRKSYTENYLIISNDFINEFEQLLRTLDDRNPNLDPSEEHEEFAAAIRAARPQLLRQARSEMPIKWNRWL